jgi:hypothetical protein
LYTAIFDFHKGGFLILKINNFIKKINNFCFISNWEIIYFFGDVEDLKFNINEKKSKGILFPILEKNLYNNIIDSVSSIQENIDQIIKNSEFFKKDERFLLKKIKEEYELEILQTKQSIASADKKIRNFKNLNIQMELEKLGIINEN